MPYLLTVIKVDNYDKWKTEFDTDGTKLDNRKALFAFD